MSEIRTIMNVLVPMALASLGGCTTSDNHGDDTHVLGIEQFQTVDNGNTTSIIGLDATGFEVGRVDIVHGVYTASPEFAVDFSAPTVDGRTLSVHVGTQAYHWETEGYAPTLSLPAAPGTFVAMGTFLEEPAVVDVMKRWGIGFEHFVAAPAPDAPSLGAEDPYVLYCSDGVQAGIRGYTAQSQTGTGGLKYTNVTSVPLPNGKTANTCGATVAAPELGIITATINSVSQYVIYQDCTLSGEDRLWKKTCPATGTTSQCGTGTGACVGCGAFTQYIGYSTDETWHTETVNSFNITNSGTTMNAIVKIAYTCN